MTEVFLALLAFIQLIIGIVLGVLLSSIARIEQKITTLLASIQGLQTWTEMHGKSDDERYEHILHELTQIDVRLNKRHDDPYFHKEGA